jgi:hypothetical protein
LRIQDIYESSRHKGKRKEKEYHRHHQSKMRLSTTLFAALSAVALAAPQFPVLNVQAAMPDNGLVTLSEYFNLLAQKVQANKVMSTAPVCDMKNAKLPVGM